VDYSTSVLPGMLELRDILLVRDQVAGPVHLKLDLQVIVIGAIDRDAPFRCGAPRGVRMALSCVDGRLDARDNLG
jgi:hypothetical protein